MLRRINLPRLAVAACASCALLLLLVGLRYSHRLSCWPGIAPLAHAREYGADATAGLACPPPSPPARDYPDEIFEAARGSIRQEIAKFTPSGVSGARRLDDLIPERGGRPLRSVIVSSWRSGSTFIGEIINAVPGTFYHYEPLRSYGTTQVRGPPHSEAALRHMHMLLGCRHSELSRLQYRTLLAQLHQNKRLWQACKEDLRLCLDPEFTSRFCRLFPYQSMKLVHLRLRLMEELMVDSELNVKVVLLVRDPRGVLQSRSHHDFCPAAPDCWQPTRICLDMVSDYEAAGRLLRRYPSRLAVVRFEDLALDLNGTTQAMLNFLGLEEGSGGVDVFLREHTSKYIGGVGSTHRVSRQVPFRWTKLLPFDFVSTIQEECAEAMSLWGYRPAHNASHLTSPEFVPMEQYSLHKSTFLDESAEKDFLILAHRT